MKTMRFAAALSVTGLLGFVILEALKILLAPLAAWLLAIAMVGVKLLLIVGAVVGACVAVGVGVYVYKRTRKDPLGTT
ncbi:MAG: hypothetical protein RH859_13940 [Longimicrobiales bacterium]